MFAIRHPNSHNSGGCVGPFAARNITMLDLSPNNSPGDSFKQQLSQRSPSSSPNNSFNKGGRRQRRRATEHMAIAAVASARSPLTINNESPGKKANKPRATDGPSMIAVDEADESSAATVDVADTGGGGRSSTEEVEDRTSNRTSGGSIDGELVIGFGTSTSTDEVDEFLARLSRAEARDDSNRRFEESATTNEQ